MMEYSSKLLENAVYEISQLPGIGKRSALRLALFLLKKPKIKTEELVTAISKFRKEIKFCRKCHNICDEELCHICKSPNRTDEIVCVVEDIQDVMAIENTSQFNGKYHVLGGKISPMDGIGPGDLNISTLVERVKKTEVKEVILALSNTMEGDTTNFYIYKQLEGTNVLVTTIARGVSVGEELEYADEVTLGRSIKHRILFEKSLRVN